MKKNIKRLCFLMLLLVVGLFLPSTTYADNQQEASDQRVELSHSQLQVQEVGLESSESSTYYWIVELTNTSDQELNIYQEIYSDLSPKADGKDAHRQLEIAAYDLSSQTTNQDLQGSMILGVDQSVVLKFSITTDRSLAYDLNTYDDQMITGYKNEEVNNESVVEKELSEEVKEASEDIPREYESALSKAYSYAKTMAMSKAGVYDQLVSEYGERFSEEAATYAIENIEWDWKANALESAKSYQDIMDMSPAAIYDQLISDYGEKFTPEEADYAIEHLPE